MNREQWQTKRGQHAGELARRLGMAQPEGIPGVVVDRRQMPLPANDPVPRRSDAESCCEWSLPPFNPSLPRR